MPCSPLPNFFILGSFAELEEQAALQNLKRVLGALQSDIDALSRAATNEASWDATYAFIENGDRGYIDSDMISVADLRLNLALFTDSTGRVVFGKGYDFENETELPASQSLLDYMASNDRLWRHADSKSHSEGIVLSPEGPMIVASRPILTTEGEGPVRGALILGRFLTPGEVNRLAEKTSLSLALDPTVQLFDLRGKDLSPPEASGMRVLPLDGKTLLGMALIRDIDGMPALALRADMTRDIYRHGRETIDYFLTWSLLASLIVGLVSYRLLDKLFSSRQELQQSEERFRSIFENTAAGMSIISPEGRLLQANPALCKFLGYGEEDLLGRKIEEFTHPDDRSATVTNDCHLFEGHCQALHFEKRYLRKDGQVPWGHASVACVQDSEGAPSYRITLLQDMTDRKRAEEELEAAKRRLQDIVDFLPDATFVIDREHKVIAWNRAIEEMTGVPKDEIIGQGDYAYALPFYERRRPLLIDLIASPDLEKEADYEVLGKKGESLFVETYLPKAYRERGAYVWAIATRLFDQEGNYAGAIESIRDITERKRGRISSRRPTGSSTPSSTPSPTTCGPPCPRLSVSQFPA